MNKIIFSIGLTTSCLLFTAQPSAAEATKPAEATCKIGGTVKLKGTGLNEKDCIKECTETAKDGETCQFTDTKGKNTVHDRHSYKCEVTDKTIASTHKIKGSDEPTVTKVDVENSFSTKKVAYGKGMSAVNLKGENLTTLKTTCESYCTAGKVTGKVPLSRTCQFSMTDENANWKALPPASLLQHIRYSADTTSKLTIESDFGAVSTAKSAEKLSSGTNCPKPESSGKVAYFGFAAPGSTCVKEEFFKPIDTSYICKLGSKVWNKELKSADGVDKNRQTCLDLCDGVVPNGPAMTALFGNKFNTSIECVLQEDASASKVLKTYTLTLDIK